MPRNPPPRKPKVTDGQLIKAVDHVCNTRKEPVAKTEWVAEVEFIDVEQQTVKRRLDQLQDEGRVKGLQIGRGWVWWSSNSDTTEDLSSDVETNADSDFEGGIYWGGIEPKQIPDEIVKQHPEYPNPDLWQRTRNKGQTILGSAMLVCIFGFGVILPRQFNLSFITLPEQINTIGLLAFVGGFVFIMFSIVILVVAELGEKIDRKADFRDALSSKLT